MAAPQATSINAIAITPDLRYWLSGGSDGYIRKYDGPGTINGKQLLTVAQRHPFVDSVVKAGVLMSYWENDEPSQPSTRGVEDHSLSPVYSLAVHSQALWVLAGCESGGINLQSVRHDEGKRITCLRQHSNAVSVLTLAQDERSVLSGSWDKRILDWDLNTGNVKRSFDGTGGQISAIELRPVSGAPIPPEASDFSIKSETLSSDNNRRPLANRAFSTASTGGVDGVPQNNPAAGDVQETQASPAHESLFGGSDTGSLFGETVGGGFGGDDDDEFSRAMGMPLDDGSGQDGGLDHSADIAAFNSGTAPPPSQERADNQDSRDNTGNSGQQQAQPPPSDEPTAASGSGPGSGSAPAEQKTAALAQEPASGQTANNPTTGATAQKSPPTSSTQPEPPRASPPPAAPASPKEPPASPSLVLSSEPPPPQHDPTQSADTVFFSAAIDGTLRIWDRRVQNPVARIATRPGVPPWCMGACWSPDGNWIYAGRRNGTVEEYSIHKARNGWEPERALRFPAGSGAVSAVRAMPNGRHLICASHDILRLYDTRDTSAFKHSSVPFLIVPGPPRAGVISALYIDRTCRYMISAAGTRGWDGTCTESLVGYEINVVNEK
ncbi:hypothetical protein ACRALDRAFT_1055257 [Sodiomyces alcalophilus JCM 7366]|uniref:uncharacterized protein n=1 Tax=Sodiomyces alcalophilus JCM 7366 TaxID=591952 RepID=UPI0039B66180